MSDTSLTTCSALVASPEARLPQTPVHSNCHAPINMNISVTRFNLIILRLADAKKRGISMGSRNKEQLFSYTLLPHCSCNGNALCFIRDTDWILNILFMSPPVCSLLSKFYTRVVPKVMSNFFFFFACELGTADEGECGGRWNQLLCYP